MFLVSPFSFFIFHRSFFIFHFSFFELHFFFVATLILLACIWGTRLCQPGPEGFVLRPIPAYAHLRLNSHLFFSVDSWLRACVVPCCAVLSARTPVAESYPTARLLVRKERKRRRAVTVVPVREKEMQSCCFSLICKNGGCFSRGGVWDVGCRASTCAKGKRAGH